MKINNETVVCLMPVYNRVTKKRNLLEEAVESFLRQSNRNALLYVCNDTPGQILHFEHARVYVENLPIRLENLYEKYFHMINSIDAPWYAKWDDDDISLPWRLTTCMNVVLPRNLQVWWPRQHWYWPVKASSHRPVRNPGNRHIPGVFSKKCLDAIGGYPRGMYAGGDQTFANKAEKHYGKNISTDIDFEDMFYLYRWGSSHNHLSGSRDHKAHWEKIGNERIKEGVFNIEPKWCEDYVSQCAALVDQGVGYHSYAKKGPE